MFVSWEMAVTGPRAGSYQRQSWPCKYHMAAQSFPGQSRAAPLAVTEQDKEASIYWHLIQMLLLIFFIKLSIITQGQPSTSFLE